MRDSTIFNQKFKGGKKKNMKLKPILNDKNADTKMIGMVVGILVTNEFLVEESDN